MDFEIIVPPPAESPSNLSAEIYPPEHQAATPEVSSNNDEDPENNKEEVRKDPAAELSDSPGRMTSLMTSNTAGDGEATGATLTGKLQDQPSGETSSSQGQELSYRMSVMAETHGDVSGQSAAERQQEDIETHTEMVASKKDEATQGNSATLEGSQNEHSSEGKAEEQEKTGEAVNGKIAAATQNGINTVTLIETLSLHTNKTTENNLQLTTEDQNHEQNPTEDNHHPGHKPSKDDQLSDTEEKPSDLAVYTRRWYILAVFSLLSFTQAAVWNTFGPISTTSEEALGWTDATIAMLSNWGPVPYILSCVFFSWLLDVKGIRPTCLLSAFLVVLGTGLRCITMETPTVTWLMHVGHFFNGAGGPLAMGGAPAVSASWFPVEERATATAIGTCCNVMGVAIAFLLGPFLVHSHRTLAPNTTHSSLERQEEGVTGTVPDIFCNSTTTWIGEEWVTGTVPDIFSNTTTTWIGANNSSVTAHTSEPLYEPDIGMERHEIQIYMFISAGWSAAVFLLIVVYFPNKPPKPPCATAGIQREDFLKGLKQLMRRKYFWLVALLYGTPFGVLSGWVSLLNLVLSGHGISEKEAGWIGFYATVTGCLLGVVVARFADIFKRVMKQFIIVLYGACSVCFLLFALAAIHIIPPSIGLFYATIISGITSINAAIPLIFELACELAYPTGEGTTNIVLTTLANVSGLIFLFIMLVPNIGSMWMNWTMSATVAAYVLLWQLLMADYNCLTVEGSLLPVVCSMWMNWTMSATVAACVPLWLLLRADYNRLTVDEAIPTLDAINTEVVVVVHPGPDTPVVEAAKS